MQTMDEDADKSSSSSGEEEYTGELSDDESGQQPRIRILGDKLQKRAPIEQKEERPRYMKDQHAQVG